MNASAAKAIANAITPTITSAIRFFVLFATAAVLVVGAPVLVYVTLIFMHLACAIQLAYEWVRESKRSDSSH